MTPTEATAQFKRLFVAFPFIRNQVNASDDPPATLAAWCQMVVTIDSQDLTQAVDDILDGKVAISLKPWDIAELPLTLRAKAGRIADARRAKVRNDQTRQEIAEKSNRTAKRDNLATNIRIAMLAGAACRDGRISRQRNAEIVAYLVVQNESPTKQTEIPAELQDDFRSLASSSRDADRVARRFPNNWIAKAKQVFSNWSNP